MFWNTVHTICPASGRDLLSGCKLVDASGREKVAEVQRSGFFRFYLCKKIRRIYKRRELLYREKEEKEEEKRIRRRERARAKATTSSMLRAGGSVGSERNAADLFRFFQTTECTFGRSCTQVDGLLGALNWTNKKKKKR